MGTMRVRNPWLLVAVLGTVVLFILTIEGFIPNTLDVP